MPHIEMLPAAPIWTDSLTKLCCNKYAFKSVSDHIQESLGSLVKLFWLLSVRHDLEYMFLRKKNATGIGFSWIKFQDKCTCAYVCFSWMAWDWHWIIMQIKRTILLITLESTGCGSNNGGWARSKFSKNPISLPQKVSKFQTFCKQWLTKGN